MSGMYIISVFVIITKAYVVTFVYIGFILIVAILHYLHTLDQVYLKKTGTVRHARHQFYH